MKIWSERRHRDRQGMDTIDRVKELITGTGFRGKRFQEKLKHEMMKICYGI